MKIKVESEVDIDIPMLAQIFAGLDDDNQARFFVEVCKIAKNWGVMGGETQWINIGSHLKNCSCSTEEAREMIRSIAYGLEHGTH